MLVGRYISLPPAIWLYAANTILFALVALRMISLTDPEHVRAHLDDRLGLIVLIVASLLTIAASFFVPKWAMLFYLVNLLDGPLRRLLRRPQRTRYETGARRASFSEVTP